MHTAGAKLAAMQKNESVCGIFYARTVSIPP